MSEVVDNPAKSRFELEQDGHVAFADYRKRDGVLTIPHVEAPPVLRGTGAAGRLMEGMLAIVRKQGLKVRPVCPYAVSYIARHKQHQDLVA
jgi:predicted GNAT family acetyltransferase